jgi:hypothetical protein
VVASATLRQCSGQNDRRPLQGRGDLVADFGAHSRPSSPSRDETAVERVLRTLSRKASGLTGADIEAVVQEARRKARREKRAITYEDIESLLAGAKQPRSMMLLNRMAVHEAGHAVARLYFRLGPIIEITIDAPDGGYTLGAVSQDEQTEELLTAILIANLAGRAAEEEIACSVMANSGGSEQSDLAIVTKLALDTTTYLPTERNGASVLNVAMQHSADTPICRAGRQGSTI